jgi:hypothetical protein
LAIPRPSACRQAKRKAAWERLRGLNSRSLGRAPGILDNRAAVGTEENLTVGPEGWNCFAGRPLGRSVHDVLLGDKAEKASAARVVFVDERGDLKRPRNVLGEIIPRDKVRLPPPVCYPDTDTGVVSLFLFGGGEEILEERDPLLSLREFFLGLLQAGSRHFFCQEVPLMRGKGFPRMTHENVLKLWRNPARCGIY